MKVNCITVIILQPIWTKKLQKQFSKLSAGVSLIKSNDHSNCSLCRNCKSRNTMKLSQSRTLRPSSFQSTHFIKNVVFFLDVEKF